jgi:hypothetical protein
MPLPDNFPALIFAVLVIFLAGAVVFYAIVPDPLRFSRLERLAYCYPVGLSALGMPMFLMSWMGFHIHVLPVLVLIGMAAVIAYAIRRVSPTSFWQRNPKEAAAQSFNEFEWFLFVIIIGCLLVRTMTSLVIPLNDGDGHAIWCFKAKILYYDTVRTTDYFARHELMYSHGQYPLLVPFMYAWVSTVVGHWDDMGMFILNPINLDVFAILLYCTLRKFAARPVALTVTAILSSLPALMHYAECGQADVPLMLISGASLFCLLDWMKSRYLPSLILASVLIAGAMFTKEEGKIIFLAHLLVAGLSVFVGPSRSERKKLFGHLGLYVAVAALWVVPWLLFQRTVTPLSGDTYRPVTLGNIHWHEIPTFCQTVIQNAVRFYNGAGLPKWNLLWPIVVLTLAISRSTRSYPYNCLVGIFLLHAVGVALVLICADFPVTLQGNEFGFERYTLIMMPPLLLVFGRCLNEWWQVWSTGRNSL